MNICHVMQRNNSSNVATDIVMAVDVGMVSKHDTDEHLRYATEHERIVVTFDREFIGLAFKRTDHAGVVGLSGNHNDVGYIVRTLTEFAELYDPASDAGKVYWF